MCGIIGIIGRDEVAPLLIDGLKRLEYRGYDSAGIATLVNGTVDRRRAEGKIVNLEKLIAGQPVTGRVGIGHTRWATHGSPTQINAHPHADDRVVLVHNGIIENFQELRRELTDAGHMFETETDTEAVVHLISHYLKQGSTPQQAVATALKRLDGAFALAILFAGHSDLMIGARRGSPLAVGYGDGEMYLGSDALALAPLTQRICYLEEGDWVEISPTGAIVHDEKDAVVEREIRQTATSGAMIGKGNYPHFMLKEIYEQPAVMGDTLHTVLNPWNQVVTLPDTGFDLTRVTKVTVVACGTSYHAGLVAKYWLEQIADVPVEVDIASEFRYRGASMPQGGMALFISQSGETADTLAALRYARDKGQHIVSVVNVDESSMARESDVVLRTQAGPEIGVASTKAFTTQLTTLACLAIGMGAQRGAIDRVREAELSRALTEVRPRRRLEAQGDQLHPRRRLRRRRDEARPHRADRRERAGYRDRAVGRAVRQDRVQHAGGDRPRRPGGLLAYHVAVLKGTDVDQPRNLATSVTVE
jgi:glucosamine--fructose-6-phosphate aminotransferase (isomerizing)